MPWTHQEFGGGYSTGSYASTAVTTTILPPTNLHHSQLYTSEYPVWSVEGWPNYVKFNDAIITSSVVLYVYDYDFPENAVVKDIKVELRGTSGNLLHEPPSEWDGGDVAVRIGFSHSDFDHEVGDVDYSPVVSASLNPSFLEPNFSTSWIANQRTCNFTNYVSTHYTIDSGDKLHPNIRFPYPFDAKKLRVKIGDVMKGTAVSLWWVRLSFYYDIEEPVTFKVKSGKVNIKSKVKIR